MNLVKLNHQETSLFKRKYVLGNCQQAMREKKRERKEYVRGRDTEQEAHIVNFKLG